MTDENGSITPNVITSSRLNIDNPEGETTLGDQLINPYTPSNMQNALDSLIIKNIIPPGGYRVRTTHYYVKFSPRDNDEYQALHDDTDHVFYDHPLDREIETAGNRYHDKSLADSIPTFQYASVEAGYQFPSGITYEI